MHRGRRKGIENIRQSIVFADGARFFQQQSVLGGGKLQSVAGLNVQAVGNTTRDAKSQAITPFGDVNLLHDVPPVDNYVYPNERSVNSKLLRTAENDKGVCRPQPIKRILRENAPKNRLKQSQPMFFKQGFAFPPIGQQGLQQLIKSLIVGKMPQMTQLVHQHVIYAGERRGRQVAA